MHNQKLYLVGSDGKKRKFVRSDSEGVKDPRSLGGGVPFMAAEDFLEV